MFQVYVVGTLFQKGSKIIMLHASCCSRNGELKEINTWNTYWKQNI